MPAMPDGYGFRIAAPIDAYGHQSAPAHGQYSGASTDNAYRRYLDEQLNVHGRAPVRPSVRPRWQ